MPRKKRFPPIPTEPIEVYKKIIDDLVDRTPSISGRLIAEDGVYSRGQGEFGKRMNAFVKRLSTEDRALLLEMLNSERQGAIGDVLAMLTWWITCHGLSLSVHGKPLPVELSGMGLEGDYIGRLGDWEWPHDATEPASGP